ncbi:MAG: DUF1573 domain-containing protein [Bacteroidia bacterium]
MKKVFYSLTLSLLVASCGNAGADGKSTDGNESTVGNDQIENPATPENPTAQNTKYAVMTFSTSEHNFGDILENQKVETTYEFVNTGKVDLLINDCQVFAVVQCQIGQKHQLSQVKVVKLKLYLTAPIRKA